MATTLNSMTLWRTASNYALNTYALDGSTKKVAGTFQAPTTGTIDRIGFYCYKTGTSPLYDFRLETLSSVRPSGTLAGTNTNGQVAPSATGWQEVTLTSSYSVTAGECLAVVCAYYSGTINASNYCDVGRYHNGFGVSSMPMSLYYNGASWTQDVYPPVGSARYSTGEYIPFACPMTACSYDDFGSSSTPDEVGVMFTAPAAIDLCGLRVFCQLYNAGGHFSAALYAGASSTTNLLTGDVTATYSTDILNEGDRNPYTFSWAPVTLTEGTDYYLSLKPTSTNTGRIMYHTWANADAATAGLGYPVTGISTTDAARAWTTSATKIHDIVPLVSSWPAAAAGSSGGYIY